MLFVMSALLSDSCMSCSSCAQYMWVSVYAGKYIIKDENATDAPDASESYIVELFAYKIIA